jgi:ketosteroid isomerase-like protein
MSEQKNKQVVQAIFGSFGRGDITGLLGYVKEDVVWNAPGTSFVFNDREGMVANFFLYENTSALTEAFS